MSDTITVSGWWAYQKHQLPEVSENFRIEMAMVKGVYSNYYSPSEDVCTYDAPNGLSEEAEKSIAAIKTRYKPLKIKIIKNYENSLSEQ